MSRRRALGAVIALVLIAGVGTAIGSLRSTSSNGPSPAAAVDPPQLARAFLGRYVDRDGRVVRLDQDGDTVSEGQAYALLLATVAGDHDRFAAVWSWTTTHLGRADGLLSWHWSQGAVVDAQPAADADLDIAAALVLEGRRLGDATEVAAGAATAVAILDHETMMIAGARFLVAGPWALRADAPAIINPSYSAPAWFTLLRGATGDTRFDELLVGSRSALAQLTPRGAMPPDWATVDGDARVTPAMSTDGTAGPGTVGYDAVRAPIRWSAACTTGDRQIAATIGKDALASTASADLRASPLVGLAAAAIDHAAGSTDVDAELDDVERAVERSPTYYATAWAALTAAMLTGDLDGCR